jgi:hypothetical protein
VDTTTIKVEMKGTRPVTLLISSVWPEPSSSAAGTRTLQLQGCFAQFGHALHLASPAARTPRSAGDESISKYTRGESVHQFPVELNNTSFEAQLRELKPNVVIFDRFLMEEQFGWRVRDTVPDALRIVDSQDLHFLRDFRGSLVDAEISAESDLVSDQWENVSKAMTTDLAVREVASFLRSDMTLIISKAEKRLLEEQNDIKKLFSVNQLIYFPFIFGEERENARSFEERSPELVMIGNFMHKPNADAVRCVRDIYQRQYSPVKASLPAVHIYGAYCRAEFGLVNGGIERGKPLDKKNNKLLIFGACDDALDTVSKYRVLFAPLRFGAGLKGKLFDAILSRTPFVTTRVGAEGIIDFGVADNSNEMRNRLTELCIADTLKEAIDKANLLTMDKSAWSEAVSLASTLLKTEFAKDAHICALKTALDSLVLGDISSKESFRSLSNIRKYQGSRNVLQRILNHGNVHYSKMLSKYIELKETNKRDTKAVKTEHDAVAS